MAESSAGRDYIGYRVARWRVLAGLSQRQLAERVGVTREYVSMIENGTRPVSTRRLISDLAHALGVSIADLTAQPIPPRNASELVLYALAPAVRRALDGEDSPPDAPRSVAEIAADVDRSLTLRMAADWEGLAAILPTLLVEASALPGDEGRLVHVKAIMNAGWTCQIAGHLDLGRRCADLAMQMAAGVGEPVHRAAAAWGLGQAALAGGSTRYALRVAEAGAELLQTSGSSDPDAPGIAGMLHLTSALSAAALGQADRAGDHLAGAAEIARVATGDPWRLEFGPGNVQLWGVAVACEQQEWGRAPELAAAINPGALHSTDRICRLHVDSARGWFGAGDPGRATEELLVAMQISARGTRVIPAVREITAQMARDAGPRAGSQALHRLVAWVGVDPLDTTT